MGACPKESVLADVRRVGLEEAVARCRDILPRREVDDRFLFVLPGLASRQVLDGREGGRDGYWPRVWALRSLRCAYSDATPTSVTEGRFQAMAASPYANSRMFRLSDGFKNPMVLRGPLFSRNATLSRSAWL